MEKEQIRKKPGRVPRISHYKTTSVSLPPEQIEWATQQPGGLARIIRECLDEKYQRENQAGRD